MSQFLNEDSVAPAKKKKREVIYSGYCLGEPYETEDVGLHIGGINFNLNRRIKLKNEIHSITYSPRDDIKLFISKS